MSKFYKKVIAEILIQSFPTLVSQIGEGVREHLSDKRYVKHPELRSDDAEKEEEIKKDEKI